MATYFDKVREKDEEFRELDNRMRLDSDLLHLKKYTMMDKSGKYAIPDVINATLNKPAVLAANVISSLGSVKQQLIVDTDNAKIDTTKIEEILQACMDMANARNRKLGFPNINQAADVGLCMRGGHARRITFRMEDGILVPDVASWDRRYVRYETTGETGREGVKWASLATMVLKGEIEAKYGIQVRTQAEKCLEIWDDEHQEIWVGNKQVKEIPHPYGYCPVVISTVALGYGDTMMDEDRLKYEGESIFFLIRDIIPQLNMLLSILETLNFLSIKPPYNYLTKEGRDSVPPEYDEALAPGAVTAGDLGGGLLPVTLGDATRAAQMIYATLEKAVQEGGYTDIDVGNVSQPFSAVALVTIGESKDQVYLPRLAAKEWLNIDTAEMILNQLKQIGGVLDLGVKGHSKQYPTSLLDGEYSVDFKYFVKSPKIDVARIAMAQQARPFYPLNYIWKEVLQVPDLQGMEEDWYSEQAEMLDPNIRTHRTIMRLLSKAEEEDNEEASWEAMILAAGMGMRLAQMQMGGGTEGGTPSLNAANSTASGTPLLGAGGQSGVVPNQSPGVPVGSSAAQMPVL